MEGEKMTVRKTLLITVSLAAFLITCGSALASDKTDAENIVDKATIVLRSFGSDPDLTWFREKVKEAKAVLIIPQSIKGALFVGGSGGTGVLVSHDEGAGTWGVPAFYTIGSLSFGLQIGGEASEVILLVMTERGMEKLLTSSFKLGADLSVAAGPVGVGTAVHTADVLSYSRSKGAFGGMAIEGAVVKTRDGYNESYYRKKVSPTDILIRKNVSNPHSDNLRKEIAELTGK